MNITVHSALKGFLPWTLCSASGNRGDDIRALKLCEIQPYVLSHPNNLTKIPAILSLQAEGKAVNPRRYLSSNVNITVTDAHGTNVSVPVGGSALRQVLIPQEATGAAVQKIEGMGKGQWFAEAGPNLFLLVGHMGLYRSAVVGFTAVPMTRTMSRAASIHGSLYSNRVSSLAPPARGAHRQPPRPQPVAPLLYTSTHSLPTGIKLGSSPVGANEFSLYPAPYMAAHPMLTMGVIEAVIDQAGDHISGFRLGRKKKGAAPRTPRG
ncbi:hypothetical protein LXA43DRAFT_1097500 [Ganoderma leucocontextum]|nr:hypothetical protein LXA43DRAFT_1097500 [Ganoderma leucocontextum]